MRTESRINLSVVIPVYGSEMVLTELVTQLRNVLGGVDSVNKKYEIIFVCDNSPDKSWEIICSLAKIYACVKGVLLRVNAGQHNALMAGFAIAKGDVIITMDDDLQHSPDDIPILLQKIYDGDDVVYARFKNKKHPFWKVIGSQFNDLVASYVLQKPKGLYLSPFRAMKSVICRDILAYRGPYVYVDGLILSVTRRVSMVEIDHHERYAGDSGYSFKKSVSLWLKMATSFSIMPLRLTSFMGIVFAGFGFISALLLIVQKFTINIMPIGWSSLIVAVLIIGGVQLLALGVIGEYLGRVLLTINSRPQYIVGESVGCTSGGVVNTEEDF